MSVVRCPSSVNNFLVNTVAATVLTRSFSKVTSIFDLMISWSSTNMGGMESKSRSLGQILVKSCKYSSGHRFDSIFLRLSQNVCLENIQVNLKMVGQELKSRSQGQILVKSCQHSSGHSFEPIFLKLA